MVPDSEILRQYFAGRDVPCPVCGYNLRDLLTDACPECGSGLRLHVHPIVRFEAAYIVGTFGLVTGVVLSLIVGVLEMSHGLARAAMPCIAMLGAIVHLVIWERNAVRLTRRGQPRRWWYALACWVWAALTVGLIFGLF